jgi:hypothetical protein
MAGGLEITPGRKAVSAKDHFQPPYFGAVFLFDGEKNAGIRDPRLACTKGTEKNRKTVRRNFIGLERIGE